MLLDLPRFLAAERPSWAELEGMLGRMAQEPDWRMSLEEAKRFHFLYQKASADLGRLTTFASEPQSRRHLEGLVARAYAEIHETRERGRGWRPGRWFLEEFPRAFRRRWAAFALAVAVTLAGALFGAGATALDEEAKEALVPAQFAHLMGNPAERVTEEERSGGERLQGAHAGFAGSLMANNIRVSITATALGMTWGLGTLVVLFYNGALLGLVAIDYVLAGQTVFLLGWLLPHGVVEIPAVLIGGQAGFVLGRALLGRGERASLPARLRAVGGDVATLLGGVAVLLVWAGLVEAFLSQYHAPVLPYGLKIGFGVAEAVLLGWFLWNGGRGKRDAGER